MKRHPFRAAEDVTRRSLMHHAPPLDERRPRHRAFDAKPSDREDRCNWRLVGAISASAACMALAVHYAPDILRSAAWVLVTLAVWGGFA